MSDPTVDSHGQHVGRAKARHAVRLTLLCVAALGLMAIALVTVQIDGRASRNGCLPPESVKLFCLGSVAPSSLTLELAGSGERLACQLHPVASARATMAPTLAERICIEARIRTRWYELTQIDQPLFMPTYALISLLVAAWIALQPSTGKPASPPLGRASKRSQVLAATGIVVTTMALLMLDWLENFHAMALLVDAERGPLTAPHYAALDAAAAKARQASLYKWAATALWASALAWGLFQWHQVANRLQRWSRGTAIATFVAAAITFAAAAGLGALSNQLAGPVRALQAGFVLAILAMCTTALAIGATPTTAAAASEDDAASLLPLSNGETAVESPPPSLTTKESEFHLEEYRQLRSEVVGLLARVELLFRAAMVVAATVFAWLVANSLGVQGDKAANCLKLPRELLWFAWMIPPAFVVCTGLMAVATYRRVTEMGGYLLQLERALGSAAMGWEGYLKRQRTVLAPMTQGLWWLLLLLTIAATLVALITVEQTIGACPTK